MCSILCFVQDAQAAPYSVCAEKCNYTKEVDSADLSSGVVPRSSALQAPFVSHAGFRRRPEISLVFQSRSLLKHQIRYDGINLLVNLGLILNDCTCDRGMKAGPNTRVLLSDSFGGCSAVVGLVQEDCATVELIHNFVQYSDTLCAGLCIPFVGLDFAQTSYVHSL